MHALRLVGVTEDGTHLVLGDGATDFVLPIDAALRAALRHDPRPSLVPGHPFDRAMSPVEVQALIRAGADAEEAAERAGWTVDKVRRYEGPILAEREHVARVATGARLRPRGAAGDAPTLLERVSRRLGDRDVSVDALEWDSWRNDDGQWVVELTFEEAGATRRASWTFTKSAMQIRPLDREAARLSDDDPDLLDDLEPAGPTDAARHEVRPDAYERTTTAYRAGYAPERPHVDEDSDLMATLRSTSRARSRRRGARRVTSAPTVATHEDPMLTGDAGTHSAPVEVDADHVRSETVPVESQVNAPATTPQAHPVVGPDAPSPLDTAGDSVRSGTVTVDSQVNAPVTTPAAHPVAGSSALEDAPSVGGTVPEASTTAEVSTGAEADESPAPSSPDAATTVDGIAAAVTPDAPDDDVVAGMIDRPGVTDAFPTIATVSAVGAVRPDRSADDVVAPEGDGPSTREADRRTGPTPTTTNAQASDDGARPGESQPHAASEERPDPGLLPTPTGDAFPADPEAPAPQSPVTRGDHAPTVDSTTRPETTSPSTDEPGTDQAPAAGRKIGPDDVTPDLPTDGTDGHRPAAPDALDLLDVEAAPSHEEPPLPFEEDLTPVPPATVRSEPPLDQDASTTSRAETPIPAEPPSQAPTPSPAVSDAPTAGGDGAGPDAATDASAPAASAGEETAQDESTPVAPTPAPAKRTRRRAARSAAGTPETSGSDRTRQSSQAPPTKKAVTEKSDASSPAEPAATDRPEETTTSPKPTPPRKQGSRRRGRASVPAWDDIMFGSKPGEE